jgi:hypothetical protein
MLPEWWSVVGFCSGTDEFTGSITLEEWNDEEVKQKVATALHCTALHRTLGTAPWRPRPVE